MQSKTKTVKEYIESLPEERRKEISAIRKIIKKNLPAGYTEAMQYGMICYGVPLSIYPAGYLGDKKTPLPYAALASQKNHIAVYLTNIYQDEREREKFINEYKKSGKRMDLGKSCVRAKKLYDLPLPLIGRAIASTSVKKFIADYEKGRPSKKKKKK